MLGILCDIAPLRELLVMNAAEGIQNEMPWDISDVRGRWCRRRQRRKTRAGSGQTPIQWKSERSFSLSPPILSMSME
jgi:hypothetical protein